MKEFTNQVVEGDAISVLQEIPSKSAPLVLVDPPYYTACKDLLPHKIRTFDEYLSWYEEWVKEVCRILVDDGSLYVFAPPLEFAEVHLLIKKYFFQKQVISWVKRNVMIRQPTTRNYLPKVELVGFYIKNEKNYTWNRLTKKFGLQKSCNFAIEPTIHGRIGEGVDHPTQKPLRLCGKFVYASSNEGDVVLDPFCGSGTTLVAAKLLNRKFTGIEINPEYCKLSRRRVGQFSVKDMDEKPKWALF